MPRKIRKAGGLMVIVAIKTGSGEEVSSPMRTGSKELVKLIDVLKEAGTHYKVRKASRPAPPCRD